MVDPGGSLRAARMTPARFKPVELPQKIPGGANATHVTKSQHCTTCRWLIRFTQAPNDNVRGSAPWAQRRVPSCRSSHRDIITASASEIRKASSMMASLRVWGVGRARAGGSPAQPPLGSTERRPRTRSSQSGGPGPRLPQSCRSGAASAGFRIARVRTRRHASPARIAQATLGSEQGRRGG